MKTLILLLFPLVVIGQPKKTTKKAHKAFLLQVDTLNSLLKQYDTLSPHSMGDFELIEHVGMEINRRLVAVLEHPLLHYYSIDKLISNEGVFIDKSPDNKFYLFNIDQKTGGSYHPYDSYLHYRFDNKRAGTISLGEAFHTMLGIVDTANEVYLISSHLFTCNTCVVESVIELSPDTTEGLSLSEV